MKHKSVEDLQETPEFVHPLQVLLVGSRRTPLVHPKDVHVHSCQDKPIPFDVYLF